MATGPSAHPAVLLREVRWNDFDDLREIYYRLYDERARGEPIGITLHGERPSLADEVDWFARMYRDVLNGEQILSVAEVDGRVIGSCSVRRHGSSASFEGGHVAVLGIVVAEAHRGRGIGEALMRHAIERCRGKFEVIRLTVFSVNERARRLYRRVGFVETGHQPRGVRRGDQYYDEEEMTHFLGSASAGPAKG